MVETEIAGAALAVSLHHRRKDDERARVDRYRDQDENGQHQSCGDEYAAQRPVVDRLTVPGIRMNLHDRGLPSPARCHTLMRPSDQSPCG
jgi:hypothetical protein